MALPICGAACTLYTLRYTKSITNHILSKIPFPQCRQSVMDSPTPTSSPSSSSPSAADQARIRRERRQAKLKKDGGSRLSKITSTQSTSKLYEAASGTEASPSGKSFYSLIQVSYEFCIALTAANNALLDILGLLFRSIGKNCGMPNASPHLPFILLSEICFYFGGSLFTFPS